MIKLSKRVKSHRHKAAQKERWDVDAAIALIQESEAKFDQSVEVAAVLGIDPKKSDQVVRFNLVLPHGTGKKLRIVVVADSDKAEEALQAGAMEAGGDEIIQKIQAGWTDFDVLVTVPQKMREIGTLGKVLGPRGLMPSPRAGTITQDVAGIVKQLQAGQVEVKSNRSGVVSSLIGKKSFEQPALAENLRAFVSALLKAKPAAAKGQFLQKLVLTSTMGPGVTIDLREVGA